MKHVFTLLMMFVVFATSGTAQSNFGHLTIISEDNEPFYLFIDGMQYNQHPSKAVRVERIAADAVRCKIVFQRPRLPVIEESFLPVADLEGYQQDITYTVSSKRRGSRALMVYHVIPMEPVQIDYNDIQVYQNNVPNRYGRWNNVNDHRYDSHRNHYRNNRVEHRGRDQRPRHNDQPCPIMSSVEFDALFNAVKKTSFDDNKFDLVELSVANYCFTTPQIMKLMSLMSFDEGRLNVAKAMYKKQNDL